MSQQYNLQRLSFDDTIDFTSDETVVAWFKRTYQAPFGEAAANMYMLLREHFEKDMHHAAIHVLKSLLGEKSDGV